MSKKIVRTICFDCHSRCGILLEVEDGKVIAVKGDKDHPLSHGYICPKGMACMEIIYHPERLTKPLIRIGERGEGKFEETSWDNALDVISKRLLEIREKWGAESFVIGQGTTRGMPPWIQRFAGLYGTPNFMTPGHMSGGPIAFGSAITAGFGLLDPDYGDSKCIVLWAHNPEQSWPGIYNYFLRKAFKEGAKLIVVDPKGTSYAHKADHWLPIRPGTDVALALCFINVIIENELYDKEFVEKWTEGFDKLKECASEFTLDRTAEITWLSSEDIEAATFTYAKTKPASIGPGIAGACQSNNSFDFARTLTILAAITGNLDVKGGNVSHIPPTLARSCYGGDFSLDATLPSKQARKKIGPKKFPGLNFLTVTPELIWDAILKEDPYPVKAIGLFANNTMCSFANSKHVKQALNALDFLFSVDYFHTPTTRMADVVLPAAHWTERDDVEDLMMKSHVFCQVKAVEPIPECRCEKEILIDLAKRMGLEGYWKSLEESLDYRLEPIGMTFEEFKEVGHYARPMEYKKYEKAGRFNTPSGKVGLCPKYIEGWGMNSIPIYREPPESPVSSPELWKDYPLVLTTGGRILNYYHSAHRNIPSLRKIAPDPELSIHPETCKKLGIEDGEWVYLVTPRGKVETKVKYFEHTNPKVVHTPHGFWYGRDDGWEKLNINQITDNGPKDPVTASVSTKALICRIEKM
ncbi:MAG: molybdopterin-containing oxidoreductase family protein [Promethearchaeota archaeon]